MIGAGLQVWGCLHALPAPTRDPAGDPTPRFAPCASRPDLASGPEAPAGPSWMAYRGRPGRAQPLQPWSPSSCDAEPTRQRLPTRFFCCGSLVLSDAFRVVGSRAGWSAARAGMVGQGLVSVRAVWEGQEPAGAVAGCQTGPALHATPAPMCAVILHVTRGPCGRLARVGVQSRVEWCFPKWAEVLCSLTCLLEADTKITVLSPSINGTPTVRAHGTGAPASLASNSAPEKSEHRLGCRSARKPR